MMSMLNGTAACTVLQSLPQQLLWCMQSDCRMPSGASTWSHRLYVAMQGRIVGQLDSSFLVVQCPRGQLVLIDQHAAHERVRLESLTAQASADAQSIMCAKITLRRGALQNMATALNASGGCSDER